MDHGPYVTKILRQDGPADPSRPSMATLLSRVPLDPNPIRAAWQRLLATAWITHPSANVHQAIELGFRLAGPGLAAVCTDRPEGERVALEMLLVMGEA